jgi:hypothetical protein
MYLLWAFLFSVDVFAAGVFIFSVDVLLWAFPPTTGVPIFDWAVLYIIVGVLLSMGQSLALADWNVLCYRASIIGLSSVSCMAYCIVRVALFGALLFHGKIARLYSRVYLFYLKQQQ